MLFEYFNTTNQTSPHFERHQTFVADIEPTDCSHVLTLPFEERCSYVTKSSSCAEKIHFFNYIDLLYCQINPQTDMGATGAISILLVCCIIVFMVLAITADQFFCPSLAVLSNILGLSENVAGVTLLAFGNGAPDIFSSLAFLQSRERRLFSDIFSGAMFVVFTVGGIIITFKPFTVQPYFFMRDALFLLWDIIFVDYVIKRNYSISALQSALTLFIYVCYLFVVFMDQYLVKRAAKNLERRAAGVHLSHTDLKRLSNLRSQTAGHLGSGISLFEMRSFVMRRARRVSIDPDDPHGLRKGRLFAQMWRTLKQIDAEEWRESSYLTRAVMLIRSPFLFVLLLMVPHLDLSEEDQGWSKLLNCLQIVLLPCLICLDTVGFMAITDVPIVVCVMCVALPIAVVVFLLTRTNSVPYFHRYFAILGAVGSIFVLRTCCAEIISILAVLGIITGYSNSFYGSTLLAWGNSMGDLIANLALARQGYQTMALSACFGGPLFNSLLAVGPTLLYQSLKEKNFVIEDFGSGTIGENCSIFLKTGLIGALLGGAISNFSLRPALGIFCILIYVIFLTYIILGELQIMHTFGTDHRMDYKPDEGL